MTGKTHIAIGLAGVANILPYIINEEFTLTWTLNNLDRVGWVLLITIIFSIVSDIEEPESMAGRMVMPFVGHGFRRIMFIIIGILSLYYWTNHTDKTIALGIGAFYLLCALFKHRESPTHSFIFIGAVGYFLYGYDPIFGYSAWTAACLHVLADTISGRVAILWPIPIKIGICIVKTNGFIDRLIVRPVGFLMIFLPFIN